MTRTLGVVCIVLGTVALALGCGLGGWPALSAVAILLGLAWLLGRWRGWGWVSSAGLLSFAAAAAAGVWLDFGAGWMLAGLVAALCAWDLDHFARRLEGVPWDGAAVARRRALERRHLLRLLGVATVGLLLAVVALQATIRLTFIPAFLLGLLVLVGLSRAIAYLLQRQDG